MTSTTCDRNWKGWGKQCSASDLITPTILSEEFPGFSNLHYSMVLPSCFWHENSEMKYRTWPTNFQGHPSFYEEVVNKE